MSKISTFIGDKLYDWHWKRTVHSYCKNFYLVRKDESIFLGQIYNMGKFAGFSALVFGDIKENMFRKVDGFKTRYHASLYILRVKGYYNEEAARDFI